MPIGVTLREADWSDALTAGGTADTLFSAPARLVTHARKMILKIPPGWAWSIDLATAWQRIHVRAYCGGTAARA
jgi:hypothetical protein